MLSLSLPVFYVSLTWKASPLQYRWPVRIRWVQVGPHAAELGEWHRCGHSALHILQGVQCIFYRWLVFQQRLAVVPDHGRHKFRKLVMLSRFVAPSVSLILMVADP